MAVLALPGVALAEPPRPTPAKLTKTLVGTHAVLHYTDAAGDTDAITPARAQEFLALLDQSAATYKQLGYTIVNDGDGKVDAYVFSDPNNIGASASGDGPGGSQRTAWIRLAPFSPNLSPVHEMFHVVHFSMDGRSPLWLFEATATWAETLFTGSGRTRFVPSGVSFDCGLPEKATCGRDEEGYGRWPFFASLAMDQGPGFLATVFTRLRELGSGSARVVGVLDELLRARGTTMSDAYLRATERLLGNSLAGAPTGDVPVADDDLLPTGNRTGTTTRRTFTLDHLSTHYFQLAGGSFGNSLKCTPAKLELTVTAPADAVTRPVFHASNSTSPPLVIPVEGGTGRITVPWTTCDRTRAFVAVPNASLTADGQAFTFAARLASVQDTRAPRLSGLEVDGRALKGKVDEKADLEVIVRRAGKQVAKLERSAKAGRFRISLPKAATKDGVTLRVTARDAAGNRSRPVAVAA